MLRREPRDGDKDNGEGQSERYRVPREVELQGWTILAWRMTTGIWQEIIIMAFLHNHISLRMDDIASSIT